MASKLHTIIAIEWLVQDIFSNSRILWGLFRFLGCFSRWLNYLLAVGLSLFSPGLHRRPKFNIHVLNIVDLFKEIARVELVFQSRRLHHLHLLLPSQHLPIDRHSRRMCFQLLNQDWLASVLEPQLWDLGQNQPLSLRWQATILFVLIAYISLTRKRINSLRYRLF